MMISYVLLRRNEHEISERLVKSQNPGFFTCFENLYVYGTDQKLNNTTFSGI